MHFNTGNFNRRVIPGVFILIVIAYVYNVNRKILLFINPTPNIVSSNTTNHEGLEGQKNSDIIVATQFQQQWCRMLSERTDWKSLLKPCDGQISWESRDALERPYWQTDPERSLVSSIDVRPAGEISRLFITTVNRNGEFKTEGGDSWRVKINGTASLSPRIQDKGDGTYEVVFLCRYEGIYNVYIYLDYSLCNGLRDPPVDWFIRGTGINLSIKHSCTVGGVLVKIFKTKP